MKGMPDMMFCRMLMFNMVLWGPESDPKSKMMQLWSRWLRGMLRSLGWAWNPEGPDVSPLP